MALNSVVNYNLPSTYDEEGNPVTVELQTGTPSFVTLAGSILTISPILFTDVKTHTMTLIVKDGEPKSTTYPLVITVTNTAPVFVSNPVD